jgi:hypothetical protein
MLAAVTNAKRYDWESWRIGIMRSLLSGGANGVISAPVSMGIDPEHFNFTSGLHHMLTMMLGMFIGAGIFHMFLYLSTHGAPDLVPPPAAEPLK